IGSARPSPSMSALNGRSGEAPSVALAPSDGLKPLLDVSQNHCPDPGRQTPMSAVPSPSTSSALATRGAKYATSAESALEPFAFAAATAKYWRCPRGTESCAEGPKLYPTSDFGPPAAAPAL